MRPTRFHFSIKSFTAKLYSFPPCIKIPRASQQMQIFSKLQPRFYFTREFELLGNYHWLRMQYVFQNTHLHTYVYLSYVGGFLNVEKNLSSFHYTPLFFFSNYNSIRIHLNFFISKKKKKIESNIQSFRN